MMTVGDFRICCLLKSRLKVYTEGSGELSVFVTFLIETSLQSMLSGVTLLRTRNHSRFVRESWDAAVRQFSAILLVGGEWMLLEGNTEPGIHRL